MTTWNELPAHLVSKIRSDSVTVPANLPGAVPALKYGNAITEADGHIYYVDTKGMRTQVYLIKKKMLLYRYQDIDFREV